MTLFAKENENSRFKSKKLLSHNARATVGVVVRSCENFSRSTHKHKKTQTKFAGSAFLGRKDYQFVVVCLMTLINKWKNGIKKGKIKLNIRRKRIEFLSFGGSLFSWFIK